MVEFAVLIGLLMLVVFGALSLGIILGRQHRLDEAAAEGARAALISASRDDAPDDVRATAVSRIQDQLDDTRACTTGSAVSCTVTVGACRNGAPDDECVTVAVAHDRAVQPLVGRLPLVDHLMPSVLDASSTVRYR